MNNANVYTALGVTRRINAAGTLTRLGGSLMAPEVIRRIAALPSGRSKGDVR